jgi:hypothetical protein
MKMRARPLLKPMALAFLLTCAVAARAGAEVQLSGTEANVVLQAKNATIAEILSDIRSTFNTPIGFTGSTARHFTGTYAGSLRRVLSRLLDGEDYVISSAAAGMNIVILRPTGAAPGLAPAGPANRAASGLPVKLAAGNDEESNPVQGWVGTVNLFPNPASAARPASPEQANAEVKPQTDEQDASSSVQGWEPKESPFKVFAARPAPAANNTSAAAEDERNPNFQGYIADWTPPEPGKSVRDAMPTLPGAIGMHGQNKVGE